MGANCRVLILFTFAAQFNAALFGVGWLYSYPFVPTWSVGVMKNWECAVVAALRSDALTCTFVAGADSISANMTFVITVALEPRSMKQAKHFLLSAVPRV